MADLETIIDSQDTTDTNNANSHPHTISDTNVKSPSRKENILPPPPPIPTIYVNNGNIYPLNRSLNGGLYNFRLKLLSIILSSKSILVSSLLFIYQLSFRTFFLFLISNLII